MSLFLFDLLKFNVPELITFGNMNMRSNSLLLFFLFCLTNCFSQVERPERFFSMKSALKKPLEVKVLDLSEQNLRILPKDILKLPNLEELSLGSNPKLDFREVFDLLAQLGKLKFLDLQNSELKVIPDNISNLKSLEILWLDDNFIEEFPEPLKRMENLKELKLFSNKIAQLAFQPGDLPNLETIDLCYNQFTQFPVELSTLTNLKSIIIWYNYIEFIPEGINQFEKLEEINLENNRLRFIPEQFSNLDSLKVLSLRFNQLSSEGIAPLYKLAGLEDIDLEGNQIVALSKEVANWKQMKRFSISENPIKGLPLEFRQLEKLEQIGFGQLQYFNWESTFSILSTLPNLRRVGMFRMNLKQMPAGFEKLQQVDTFWLTFNLFDQAEQARIQKMVPKAKITW